MFYPNLVPNWLRDENDKVLLFGGLMHVFEYLDEQAQQQKYAELFARSIEELNKEEKVRKASGGNVQINYDGNGLL